MTSTNRSGFFLALLSAGSLLLELALTRLFSAIYYPPYVFAVLSLAVLGIGLGAALAARFPRLNDVRYQPLYPAAAALAALVILAVLVLSLPLGGLIFVLLPWPYLALGLAYAQAFSRSPQASPTLYMADLLGAGFGAILAIPIMNAVSPVNAVLVAALSFGAAGLIARRARLPAAAVAVALIVLVGNLAAPFLTIRYGAATANKPIGGALATGTIRATHWDAFARTDLVQPNDGSPYQLYIDGAAASIMPPATNNDTLISSIGFFPFATNQPPRVLVIGPGGGLDVWFGLKANSQSITAVEVNPASLDLVRSYADYNGDLYGQPQVSAVLDEGRSLLRRDATQYDLIFLSQVVTLTSERLGSALTENTIYTIEAFRDYFAHLTDKGYVALVLYDELTLTRALSTVLAALRETGLSDAEAIRYTAAFLDTRSGKPTPLLMIGKQPFSREDSLTYNAVARQVGFIPLYLPEVYAQSPLDAVEAGTQTYDAIVAQSESDLSPTTDDRPFFFQFERGLPPDLQPVLALLAAIVVLGGGVLAFAQRRAADRAARLAPVYFAALGVGFMGIEVTLIQQTRLFLGHPTLAVTTTLAVLLIGGGLGSLLASRLKLRSARWPALGVILLLLVWLLVWPAVSASLLGLPGAARVTVTALGLLPLALLLGMPFPLGLRRLSGGRDVALAWAVNGVATVVGTVGATTLATLSGYRAVLVAGMIAYAVAALYAFLTNRASSQA